MPSNVSIVSSDVPSDAQPINLIAGEAIAKDQLLCYSTGQKVFPAKGSKDFALQSLLIRAGNDPLVVSEVIPTQGVNQRPVYNSINVETWAFLGNGNIAIPSSDNVSPPTFYVNIFTPDGTFVARSLYYQTNTAIGTYIRKVDASRFMVIWILDIAAEQLTYRYIIYNNDGSVSQALTTVVITPNNLVRQNNISTTVTKFNFIVTSDGYVIAAFGNNGTFYLVSWTLAGVIRATTTSLMSNTYDKPELVEIPGFVFCKVYDAGNGSALFFKFPHTFNGVATTPQIGGIGSSSSAIVNRTTLIRFGNGVLIADRSAGNPWLGYCDGDNITPIAYTYPTNITASSYPSLHDIGDGEAIAIFPNTSAGPFVAIRVDQALKARVSGLINLAFVGSGTYGWICPRITKTPDALAFTFVDYGSVGSITGYFITGMTLALDWPQAGALIGSLGARTNIGTLITAPYNQHLTFYSQGEFRMIACMENGNYIPNFRLINIRKSSIIGVAAAAAAKDTPVSIKTKGFFTLPNEQDYGTGFSFTPTTQGVVGTGGRLIGRNALLTGIFS